MLKFGMFIALFAVCVHETAN